jgi:hypothetical protein
MQPAYVAFDVALAVLSLRSIAVLRARAPWTSGGWAATLGYCIAAAVEFSNETLHQPAAYIAYAFLLLLTIAFVVAGVRDEPQAEPWWWPTHVGPTRAEKRATRHVR